MHIVFLYYSRANSLCFQNFLNHLLRGMESCFIVIFKISNHRENFFSSLRFFIKSEKSQLKKQQQQQQQKDRCTEKDFSSLMTLIMNEICFVCFYSLHICLIFERTIKVHIQDHELLTTFSFAFFGIEV